MLRMSSEYRLHLLDQAMTLQVMNFHCGMGMDTLTYVMEIRKANFSERVGCSYSIADYRGTGAKCKGRGRSDTGFAHARILFTLVELGTRSLDSRRVQLFDNLMVQLVC